MWPVCPVARAIVSKSGLCPMTYSSPLQFYVLDVQGEAAHRAARVWELVATLAVVDHVRSGVGWSVADEFFEAQQAFALARVAAMARKSPVLGYLEAALGGGLSRLGSIGNLYSWGLCAAGASCMCTKVSPIIEK